MKIYVVTKGSYSDYHIVGVYTDKEDAQFAVERCADKWDTPQIEEYDTEMCKLPLWEVQISLRDDSYRVLPYNEGGNEGDYVFHETYCAKIRADTAVRAVKIASERLAQMRYREAEEGKND